MHDHDWLERARARLVKPLGIALKGTSKGGLSLYAEGDLQQWEFLAHVDLDKEDTEQLLCSAGFDRNPASAYKYLRATDDEEAGSWAWWGHPPTATDSGRLEPDRLSPMQLHVHLFEVDDDAGTTAVFGHWEPSWITRPVTHYTGWGERFPPGYKIAGTNVFYGLVGEHGDGSAVMWGGENVLLTSNAGVFWNTHDL